METHIRSSYIFRNFTLAALLLTTFQLCLCSPMRFAVNGFPKCFTEEIKKGTISVGTYKVVQVTPGDPDRVNARLSGAHGEELHFHEAVRDGHFAFTTTDAGQYVACFWLPMAYQKHETAHVELDWKVGLHATDYESVAKKEKLDAMGLELRKLEDMAHELKGEMAFYRVTEEKMRDVVELTNTRVAYFGVLGLILCAGLAGLQLWYLKTYFERKKIL